MNSPQPPKPPQESTDIFSLSDQVLCDRLEFIEEVTWETFARLLSFNSTACRLDLGTGGAFGYVVPNQILNHHPRTGLSRFRKPKLRLNWCIGHQRHQRLLLALGHCKLCAFHTSRHKWRSRMPDGMKWRLSELSNPILTRPSSRFILSLSPHLSR